MDPIREAGGHPASGTPRSAEEFLDWVAALHPDTSAATLADVVDRARSIRDGNDADWRPPFMTDVNTRVDGAAPDLDADASDEAGSRLFAPTQINAVYTGPGAAGQPAGYPPAGPSDPGPAPGYAPPPGHPPAYPPPGYPPVYGSPPGYPPGYPQQAAPPQAPAYGRPPAYGPAQQLPSPYYDPNGVPGAGVLPAWDALTAQQRSEHFVVLPGWAQSLLWAQLTPSQRRELAAVLPPRPGA